MKFKESPLVKNHKILTGTKRDMRKKVVKSTTPTSDLKKPTTLKRQLGGNIFTTYNSIAPYEGPVFEQPVATVEIEELPVNRLETNRQNVMAKAEEKKEEPVVEEKVSTEPLPTSKEEAPAVENKESTPIAIKTKDEFIKTMTPAFENALKAKGLDTKYAKYLVAQSALESNWGKSQSGKFNFGGIKGKGTVRKTREVINGKSIHINDSFRDFKDINDYANYHVSLLNNKKYQAFSGGDFIDRVVKGGYATDPNYKRALSNVYNQIAKAQEGMKIPKLKGAGELRNRILRQFNKEKAANRNEEQLIGFDWSRYKSNKPKPETTPTEPTQSEQLENGGVIKAQDGDSLKKSEELLVRKALEFGQKTFEKISPYDIRLIDFIKSKEGFRPIPKRDETDGKLTVGYGLTDPKLIQKYKNGITEEEAARHLIQHLRRGADSLTKMSYYDNLNLGEKTALNDLIYNVGWNKFKKSKNLQSHLRTGNDAGAKKEMNHGEHQARGLRIRRNQNRQMYDNTFNWKYNEGGVI